MTTILVAPERWTQSPLWLEQTVFLHRPTCTSSDQFASPLGFSSALNAQAQCSHHRDTRTNMSLRAALPHPTALPSQRLILLLQGESSSGGTVPTQPSSYLRSEKTQCNRLFCWTQYISPGFKYSPSWELLLSHTVGLKDKTVCLHSLKPFHWL